MILSRGKEKHFIEIKSSDKIDDHKVERFSRAAHSLKGTSLYYVSRDLRNIDQAGVKCRHWLEFLREVFVG